EDNAHGACLAAGSEHLPLKGGEPALGLDRRKSDVSDLRFKHEELGYTRVPRVDRPGSSPGQAPRREGVAIPTPSLAFSRGGRRLRPARSQMPDLREEREETADPPQSCERVLLSAPSATRSTSSSASSSPST